MSLQTAIVEWSHRRYWPTKVWHQNRVNYGVGVVGDPDVPPKGLFTPWRRKWSWAVVAVSVKGQSYTGYYPGYSLDNGHTFRLVIRPVMTHYFAFQIGPDPVMFSVFDKTGGKLEAECYLCGTYLPWSQAVLFAKGEHNITFV